MIKKIAIICVSCFLLLFIFAASAAAVILSGAVSWIGDAFENAKNAFTSQSYNEVQNALGIFYESGQMKLYADEISKYLDYTSSKEHIGLIIAPVVILDLQEMDEDFINYLDNALSKNDLGTNAITDIETYARAIKGNPYYYELNGYSINSLVTILEMTDKYSSLLLGYADSLPDWYIEQIGRGFGYPFTKYYGVTAHVGLYNPFGEWEEHSGTDFGAPLYTPVYAVKSGEVVSVGDKNCHTDGLMSTACYVNVYSEEDDLYIMYYHFAMPSSLEVGDKVKLGDQVGVVGATGYATGNHLHLEIRKHNASGTVIDYCQLTDCDNPVYADIEGKE